MLHAIMNLKLLHIIGISLFSFYATGQKLNEISPSLLKDGIYLENTEVMIPWKTTLDSIKNYGNPKVVHVRKNYTEAQWDSVKIFNGLKLNLTGYFWNPPGKRKLKHFYSYVDSALIPTLKTHLDLYFSTKGKKKGGKKDTYFYGWDIYNCHIRIGHFPNGKYYFWIQRK